MTHFIQLSHAFWLNTDLITVIRLCTEREDPECSPYYHILMQGQDEELALTPPEHAALALYLRRWSLRGLDSELCPFCSLELIEQSTLSPNP